MLALDLFCGAGGACVGLQRAGFKVVGVDINPQPDYPGEFIRADVGDISPLGIDRYMFIWASPPCQAYSVGGNSSSRAKYPRLIEWTRALLTAAGVPYAIENVPRAPLRPDVKLCGRMFNLPLVRHRIIEVSGFTAKQPPHPPHSGSVSGGDFVGVYRGGRCGCFGNKEKRNKLKAPTVADAQRALGITHINTFAGLAEAIPPAYSEYIAREFLAQPKCL